MAKNTVERTEATHVVSFKADPTVDIPKGAAIMVSADYEVTIQTDQDEFVQGVSLQPHASGQYDCIPVLLAGPVIRVTAGDTIVYGQKVGGDATVPGEWIVDTDDSAGFALESADDGEEFDMVFVGEIY